MIEAIKDRAKSTAIGDMGESFIRRVLSKHSRYRFMSSPRSVLIALVSISLISSFLYLQALLSVEFSSSHHFIIMKTLPSIKTNTRPIINTSSCQGNINNTYYYYKYYINSSNEPESHKYQQLQDETLSTTSKSKGRRRLHMDHSTFEPTLDPDNILIESDYIGFHPNPQGVKYTKKFKLLNSTREEEDYLFQPGNLPWDFVMATMHAFAHRQTHKIHKRYIAKVLSSAKNFLASQPSLLRLSVPMQNVEDQQSYIITVVGDLHGDLYALLHIFDTNGFPSLNHRYIFNGDVMDKGSRSVEAMISLLMIQLSCPQCIMITRGNHEDVAYLRSRVKTELDRLYGSGFFPLLVDVVNALPLATLVEEKILVVHGGIINPNLTLEEINQTERGMGISLNEHDIMTDLLWSDPSDDHLGVEKSSKRWHTFGKDIVESFLEKNNLSLLVRSHQIAMDGARTHHNGRTITIYSAPLPNTSMRGAYMNIDASNMDVKCNRFHPKDKKISWQKYGFNN